MGRSAAGVRGIRLGKKDQVVGVVTLRRKDTAILVATVKGFGKRSEADEYRVSHRGGKGIKTVKISDKTGPMVVIKEVVDTDDIVIVTTNGMVIRQNAAAIRVAGRNTQGVRLIRLQEGDSIADIAAVVAEEEEEKELARKESERGNKSKQTNGQNGVSGGEKTKKDGDPETSEKKDVKPQKVAPSKKDVKTARKKPEPRNGGSSKPKKKK